MALTKLCASGWGWLKFVSSSCTKKKLMWTMRGTFSWGLVDPKKVAGSSPWEGAEAKGSAKTSKRTDDLSKRACIWSKQQHHDSPLETARSGSLARPTGSISAPKMQHCVPLLRSAGGAKRSPSLPRPTRTSDLTKRTRTCFTLHISLLSNCAKNIGEIGATNSDMLSGGFPNLFSKIERSGLEGTSHHEQGDQLQGRQEDHHTRSPTSFPEPCIWVTTTQPHMPALYLENSLSWRARRNFLFTKRDISYTPTRYDEPPVAISVKATAATVCPLSTEHLKP